MLAFRILNKVAIFDDSGYIKSQNASRATFPCELLQKKSICYFYLLNANNIQAAETCLWLFL